ncbi:hypothetical protein AYI69_g5951 [Smittium culicis]|uniref:Uncharacterized protein n=1 Tax=Smittium culicis TaxID=133412 RepID=A0A1R1Y2D3_9FUNG|nr:hypothetical protein AYI69_g5951 [Smittium culicis]
MDSPNEIVSSMLANDALTIINAENDIQKQKMKPAINPAWDLLFGSLTCMISVSSASWDEWKVHRIPFRYSQSPDANHGQQSF